MLTEESHAYGGVACLRRRRMLTEESLAYGGVCYILHLRRSVNIIYKEYILIVCLVKCRVSFCPFVSLSERIEWCVTSE